MGTAAPKTHKLQHALLRRKELQQRVDRLKPLQAPELFVLRQKRVSVADGTDEVTAHVPVLTAGQVDGEFNYYARQLREIDAVIQQTNWTADVEIADLLTDYEVPADVAKALEESLAHKQVVDTPPTRSRGGNF